MPGAAMSGLSAPSRRGPRLENEARLPTDGGGLYPQVVPVPVGQLVLVT